MTCFYGGGDKVTQHNGIIQYFYDCLTCSNNYYLSIPTTNQLLKVNILSCITMSHHCLTKCHENICHFELNPCSILIRMCFATFMNSKSPLFLMVEQFNFKICFFPVQIAHTISRDSVAETCSYICIWRTASIKPEDCKFKMTFSTQKPRWDIFVLCLSLKGSSSKSFF